MAHHRTRADGQPLKLHHHGMEVMHKVEDGPWAFYIDHPYGADRSWDIDRPAHQVCVK